MFGRGASWISNRKILQSMSFILILKKTPVTQSKETRAHSRLWENLRKAGRKMLFKCKACI